MGTGRWIAFSDNRNPDMIAGVILKNEQTFQPVFFLRRYQNKAFNRLETPGIFSFLRFFVFAPCCVLPRSCLVLFVAILAQLSCCHDYVRVVLQTHFGVDVSGASNVQK